MASNSINGSTATVVTYDMLKQANRIREFRGPQGIFLIRDSYKGINADNKPANVELRMHVRTPQGSNISVAEQRANFRRDLDTAQARMAARQVPSPLWRLGGVLLGMASMAGIIVGGAFFIVGTHISPFFFMPFGVAAALAFILPIWYGAARSNPAPDPSYTAAVAQANCALYGLRFLDAEVARQTTIKESLWLAKDGRSAALPFDSWRRLRPAVAAA